MTSGDWTALTKQEHDLLMTGRTRPITQDPIRRRKATDNTVEIPRTIWDALIDSLEALTGPA